MSGTKILVIDDDRRIADSLQRVLSYEGFAVKAAGDGPSGLAVLESFQPDLVVLDVVMPGLSGLEVCRRLKEIIPVPVLFLSARDEVDDRVRGLNGGGDDYLVKPFAAEELVARVRALLRRSGSQPMFPLLGLRLTPWQLLLAMNAILITSLTVTALGILLAAGIKSIEGFGTLQNFLVMPMFFLSGAMYPPDNVPGWLRPLAAINPLTCGVDLVRGAVLQLRTNYLLDIRRSGFNRLAFITKASPQLPVTIHYIFCLKVKISKPWIFPISHQLLS